MAMRMEMLKEVCASKGGEDVGVKILQAAAAGSVKDQYEQKRKETVAMLEMDARRAFAAAWFSSEAIALGVT